MSQQAAPNKPIKNLSGYVAKNKKTSDKQPDWRGKVHINGKDYLVGMWQKSDNPELMSFSLTDPDTLAPRPQQDSQQGQQGQPRQGQGQQSQISGGGSDDNGGEGDIFGDIFGSL